MPELGDSHEILTNFSEGIITSYRLRFLIQTVQNP